MSFMEKNIFENAKFGDKFLTRDGRIALYVMDNTPFHVCVINPLYNKNPIFWSYNGNGTSLDEALTEDGIDIISRYKKPIDEKHLDKLAEEWNDWDDNSDETEWSYTHKDICNAYKAGYYKGKEE